MSLPGAHRTTKACASGFYIRWTAWRGRGAPEIGKYHAAARAGAEALEKADETELARRYGEQRGGAPARPHGPTLADVFTKFEAAAEFKRCSDSTKRERARVLKDMQSDDFGAAKSGQARLKLGALPAAALDDPRMLSRFEAWRDEQAVKRGPRAADYRIGLARLALSWAKPRGLAPANPCEEIAAVWRADRSDLIWEPQHLQAFLAAIKKRIAEIWEAEPATVTRHGRVELNRNRTAQIVSLAAARDALLLACNSGMRREDLAAHAWSEKHGRGIVYTARKGARRARTAGTSRGVTVVPVLDLAALVYARRWEFSAGENPWVITSARGGPYKPNGLGKLVNELAGELGIDRTLHDGKGTFVTYIATLTTADDRRMFTNSEIGRMVDWSEDDVDRIVTRYVSANAIANALLERIKRRRKS